MPKVDSNLPQVPDNAWKDLQFRFDGRWLPDIDPSLIGPNNYATLENLRYKDTGLEGVNGYSKINTAALDGSGVHTNLGNFPKIRNGHHLRSDRTQKSYTLVNTLDSNDRGRVFVNRTAIGSQGAFDASSNLNVLGNPYFEDASVSLTGRFSDSPRGNVTYANGEECLIFGGDEQSVAAVFGSASAAAVPTLPVDYTDEMNDNITTNKITFATGATDNLVLMTTRPIQAVKFYINAGSTPGTLTVKYWDGSTWQQTGTPSDGTTGLTSTGVYSFDHTKTTVKLKHYEELYLYAYLVTIVDIVDPATAEIYAITVDPAMQDIVNVWDGVYRQPVQLQVMQTATSTYSDYTAQGNVASEEDNPIGVKLTTFEGNTSTGEFVIMFTEQVAGIRMQMLGSLVNNAASTMTLKYWNGAAYAAVGTQVDGTSGFQQSGLISWVPNVAEKPRTLFNTFGYAYEITMGTDLVPDNVEIYVDLVTGVPAQKTLKGYDFTSQYGTRVMLCSPSQENEGNRIDFSVPNAPDVYNGADSSADGAQSLYFGGFTKVTAAQGLYNRFGSNILSLFLVLKDSETYLLVGDTPDEFTIYPVSKTIGCPAPQTLAVGEVNLGKGSQSGSTRNIAIWLSASGPMMFDGAALNAVRGIENFFDPNSTEYIEWDVITRARGWIDNIYKEYNLLIPSASGSTECNKWLVYDLFRKKWYEKKTGSAQMPQAAWEVITTTGERYHYGGVDAGYMLHLENGTSWSATGITQKIKTGDFFPSSNIWDETLIRKFKLLCHKFSDVTVENFLDILYYGNTSALVDSSVVFVDSDDGITGVNVDFTDTTDVLTWSEDTAVSVNVNQNVGDNRLLHIISDQNYLGWAHAFEFSITTDDITRGFRPIAWGVRYRIERKFDQTTETV